MLNLLEIRRHIKPMSFVQKTSKIPNYINGNLRTNKFLIQDSNSRIVKNSVKRNILDDEGVYSIVVRNNRGRVQTACCISIDCKFCINLIVRNLTTFSTIFHQHQNLTQPEPNSSSLVWTETVDLQLRNFIRKFKIGKYENILEIFMVIFSHFQSQILQRRRRSSIPLCDFECIENEMVQEWNRSDIELKPHNWHQKRCSISRDQESYSARCWKL